MKFSHILLIILTLTSCMKDDELWERNPLPAYNPNSGVFIINEGNFMYGNASLSFYDLESGDVHNDIFFEANALPLGDVAQSMTIKDSLGYVVINNSGKIQVINIDNYRLHGKITGLTAPRFIHFINEEKAYVSDLYSQSLSVIDPESYEVISDINISDPASRFNLHSSEQIILYKKYVFTNSWSFDDKVLVIDSEKDKLIDSIKVILQPNSMVLDRFNKLWVLSDGGYNGNPAGHAKPGLTRVNAETLEIEKIFYFDKEQSPTELTINGTGDTLYFINQNIYRHSVLSDQEPELFFESPYNTTFRGYYGLGVDPFNSEIYIADAIDHLQPGSVYRLNPRGQIIDTFKVGIAPGSFCFKEAEKKTLLAPH